MNAAHVSFEQFNFCEPLPHVIGSPHLGVLSVRLNPRCTSQHSRFVSLFAVLPSVQIHLGLPCSSMCAFGNMLSVRTPGCLFSSPKWKSRCCLPRRGKRSASPTSRSISGLMILSLYYGLLPFCLRFAMFVRAC